MVPLARRLSVIGCVLLVTGALITGTLTACSSPTAETAAPGALPHGVSVLRQGAASDARPALTGPSLVLQGDGRPLREAFAAHVAQVASAPLDVVVLAASPASGPSPTPECDRLLPLSGVQSCTTITIPRPAGADVAAVADTVRQAEVVYFAGGSQCAYVGWRGRAVLAAVRSVAKRGGGVGGGSAGLAIQGALIYDGCAGSVRSTEALADPYHDAISFSDRLFDWPALDGLITDSHFAGRDRMGRLVAFIGRHVAGQNRDAFSGLGVNDRTAVVVDAAGQGTVFSDRAYLVHGDHAPETLRPGTPLTYRNVAVRALPAGTTYDLRARPLDSATRHTVEAGAFTTDPYAP